MFCIFKLHAQLYFTFFFFVPTFLAIFLEFFSSFLGCMKQSCPCIAISIAVATFNSALSKFKSAPQ